MKILSIKIAELRKQNNLTQAQLATAVGVSPSCVGCWEKERRTPKMTNIILLAKHFNVKLDFLLGLKD